MGGQRRAAKAKLLEERMAECTDAFKERTRRACETGAWLTVLPVTANGTDLSADEFRDSLCLRYGITPRHLPATCDGCGDRFTVGHAMTCRRGGLVRMRHGTMSDEWHRLCASALIPSAVTNEPVIQPGRCAQGSGPNAPPAIPELRGDIAARGFWKANTTAIFDVRVTDTDAPSNRGRPAHKTLQVQEREKKAKYLSACLERRMSFTPLVFSVDGQMGQEAAAATKRLALLLAGKWRRHYSDTCGFVRSRIAISLARTVSMCLRGSRNPSAHVSRPHMESGAGLRLYQ